jgi:hypothetical protein
MLLPNKSHPFRSVLNAVDFFIFLGDVEEHSIFQDEIIAAFPEISLGVCRPAGEVLFLTQINSDGIQRNFTPFHVLLNKKGKFFNFYGRD